MIRRIAALLCAVGTVVSPELAAEPAADYVPPRGDAWERRDPAELGLDAERLLAAVRYAQEQETSVPVDLEQYMRGRLANQPHGELLGPLAPRGGPNGLILHRGYLVAEWGDTHRIDVAYSVTKSFLATLAGLAVERGLISGLDARVADTVRDGGFESPHNAAITWRHLLEQTSEWQGTLWGKPDTADRRRGVDRELQVPGTFWEYNDVRVNRAALALLRVWQRALPDVLRDEVMTPIGASEGWQWYGYSNSYIYDVAGRVVNSVAGGGHWGGGLWISSRDLARFGLLHLRRGRWQGRQILPDAWIDALTTPTRLKPTYGLMWWLNTDRELWPSAPTTSYAARGGGANLIWIDPEHDLVAVVRWIERGTFDGFLELLLSAVQPGGVDVEAIEPAPVESTLPYVDVTATHLPVLDGPTMDAAVADVDADGDLDLLLAQEHQPNILLINDGSGRLTNVSAAQLPQVARDSEDIAFGDFDGDGDVDAVVVSEDDEINELYLNDGRGHFTDGGDRLPVTGRTNAVVTADLDGDGALDLILGNSGQNVLLLNDGQGHFREATGNDGTQGRLPAVEDITQDLELGDVDGDGDLDLLVGNQDANRLLINDGQGVFRDVELPMREVPEETREADFGDVDGDGNLDILFANIRGFVRDADPRNRLLLGEGTGHDPVTKYRSSTNLFCSCVLSM
ncbi:MAG: FG-GAP-like repeat-containing protein [Acidobacteriota bacterium]